MLKSPEQYLLGLAFEPPEAEAADASLKPGERAFIEKYLGSAALEKLPRLEPEPVPLPEPAMLMPAPVRKPAPVLEVPRIIVAPAPEIAVISPEEKFLPLETALLEETDTGEDAPAPVPTGLETVREEKLLQEEALKEEVVQETAARDTTIQETTLRERLVQETAPGTELVQKAQTPPAQAVLQTPAPLAGAQPLVESLRERMKEAEEIQMVSFYVSGQLFLLPVAGIQEVLRHMELVKVPQAPPFVAGAINLRGHVMPLVHLSALLTTSQTCHYDKQSFIIVCGSDDLRVGLIIDRVNSMHMLPKDKLIWNVEARLGEAAECLCAIANLNDRVCGIVDPDMVAKKILS